MAEITKEEIDRLFMQLNTAAERGGYHLNPQVEDTRELVKGLLVNEKRYGYWACPCREATGIKAADLDIICPCDYRDPDLHDFNACFCGLYVSAQVLTGRQKVRPVPERRPAAGPCASNNQQEVPMEAGEQTERTFRSEAKLKYPVWRCKVCGYLCAREHPPETCPVCKADKERFEVFI